MWLINIQDDEYMGYHLPKDSIIVANAYAISRDPMMFSSPDTFLPERFMDSEEVPFEGEMKNRIHSFGHGRRYV